MQFDFRLLIFLKDGAASFYCSKIKISMVVGAIFSKISWRTRHISRIPSILGLISLQSSYHTANGAIEKYRECPALSLGKHHAFARQRWPFSLKGMASKYYAAIPPRDTARRRRGRMSALKEYLIYVIDIMNVYFYHLLMRRSPSMAGKSSRRSSAHDKFDGISDKKRLIAYQHMHRMA